MATCEKLGLEKDFYSVSIPLGATINMDGAAAVITIMSLSVARTMGVEVSIPTAIALSFLSTLAACGASGVAGGSLLLIPMACSFFGISNDVAMQAVEVGFIIGVIQDSVETALNSSGDVVFSATAEYYARRKRGEDMRFLGDYAKKKKDAPAEPDWCRQINQQKKRDSFSSLSFLFSYWTSSASGRERQISMIRS